MELLLRCCWKADRCGWLDIYIFEEPRGALGVGDIRGIVALCGFFLMEFMSRCGWPFLYLLGIYSIFCLSFARGGIGTVACGNIASSPISKFKVQANVSILFAQETFGLPR